MKCVLYILLPIFFTREKDTIFKFYTVLFLCFYRAYIVYKARSLLHAFKHKLLFIQIMLKVLSHLPCQHLFFHTLHRGSLQNVTELLFLTVFTLYFYYPQTIFFLKSVLLFQNAVE